MPQHTLAPSQRSCWHTHTYTHWYLSQPPSALMVFAKHNSSTWQFLLPSKFTVEFHFIAQASSVNKQKKKFWNPKRSQAPRLKIVSESKLEIGGLNCRFQFSLVIKGGLLLNSSFSRPITRRQCRQTTEPTSPRRSLGRIQHLKSKDRITDGRNYHNKRKLILDTRFNWTPQYSPHRLFFVVAFETEAEFCSVTIFIRFTRDRNLSHML